MYFVIKICDQAFRSRLKVQASSLPANGWYIVRQGFRFKAR
jgi:hypothetical protein